MADQVATVSKERLFRRADILSLEDMRKVQVAIKVQLDNSLTQWGAVV